MKANFRPVLTKDAETVISSYYQLQRRSATQNAGTNKAHQISDPSYRYFLFFDTGKFVAISARTTVRMLESLIRLAQGNINSLEE